MNLVKKWAYGLAAAFVTSSTTALGVWIAAPQLDKATMIKIVLIPTALGVFGYLKQSPLPPLADE